MNKHNPDQLETMIKPVTITGLKESATSLKSLLPEGDMRQKALGHIVLFLNELDTRYANNQSVAGEISTLRSAIFVLNDYNADNYAFRNKTKDAVKTEGEIEPQLHADKINMFSLILSDTLCDDDGSAKVELPAHLYSNQPAVTFVPDVRASSALVSDDVFDAPAAAPATSNIRASSVEAIAEPAYTGNDQRTDLEQLLGLMDSNRPAATPTIEPLDIRAILSAPRMNAAPVIAEITATEEVVVETIEEIIAPAFDEVMPSDTALNAEPAEPAEDLISEIEAFILGAKDTTDEIVADQPAAIEDVAAAPEAVIEEQPAYTPQLPVFKQAAPEFLDTNSAEWLAEYTKSPKTAGDRLAALNTAMGNKDNTKQFKLAEKHIRAATAELAKTFKAQPSAWVTERLDAMKEAADYIKKNAGRADQPEIYQALTDKAYLGYILQAQFEELQTMHPVPAAPKRDMLRAPKAVIAGIQTEAQKSADLKKSERTLLLEARANLHGIDREAFDTMYAALQPISKKPVEMAYSIIKYAAQHHDIHNAFATGVNDPANKKLLKTFAASLNGLMKPYDAKLQADTQENSAAFNAASDIYIKNLQDLITRGRVSIALEQAAKVAATPVVEQQPAAEPTIVNADDIDMDVVINETLYGNTRKAFDVIHAAMIDASVTNAGLMAYELAATGSADFIAGVNNPANAAILTDIAEETKLLIDLNTMRQQTPGAEADTNWEAARKLRDQAVRNMTRAGKPKAVIVEKIAAPVAKSDFDYEKMAVATLNGPYEFSVFVKLRDALHAQKTTRTATKAYTFFTEQLADKDTREAFVAAARKDIYTDEIRLLAETLAGQTADSAIERDTITAHLVGAGNDILNPPVPVAPDIDAHAHNTLQGDHLEAYEILKEYMTAYGSSRPLATAMTIVSDQVYPDHHAYFAAAIADGWRNNRADIKTAVGELTRTLSSISDIADRLEKKDQAGLRQKRGKLLDKRNDALTKLYHAGYALLHPAVEAPKIDEYHDLARSTYTGDTLAAYDVLYDYMTSFEHPHASEDAYKFVYPSYEKEGMRKNTALFTAAVLEATKDDRIAMVDKISALAEASSKAAKLIPLLEGKGARANKKAHKAIITTEKDLYQQVLTDMRDILNPPVETPAPVAPAIVAQDPNAPVMIASPFGGAFIYDPAHRPAPTPVKEAKAKPVKAKKVKKTKAASVADIQIAAPASYADAVTQLGNAILQFEKTTAYALDRLSPSHADEFETLTAELNDLLHAADSNDDAGNRSFGTLMLEAKETKHIDYTTHRKSWDSVLDRATDWLNDARDTAIDEKNGMLPGRKSITSTSDFIEALDNALIVLNGVNAHKKAYFKAQADEHLLDEKTTLTGQIYEAAQALKGLDHDAALKLAEALTDTITTRSDMPLIQRAIADSNSKGASRAQKKLVTDLLNAQAAGNNTTNEKLNNLVAGMDGASAKPSRIASAFTNARGALAGGFQGLRATTSKAAIDRAAKVGAGSKNLSQKLGTLLEGERILRAASLPPLPALSAYRFNDHVRYVIGEQLQNDLDALENGITFDPAPETIAVYEEMRSGKREVPVVKSNNKPAKLKRNVAPEKADTISDIIGAADNDNTPVRVNDRIQPGNMGFFAGKNTSSNDNANKGWAKKLIQETGKKWPMMLVGFGTGIFVKGAIIAALPLAGPVAPVIAAVAIGAWLSGQLGYHYDKRLGHVESKYTDQTSFLKKRGHEFVSAGIAMATLAWNILPISKEGRSSHNTLIAPIAAAYELVIGKSARISNLLREEIDLRQSEGERVTWGERIALRRDIKKSLVMDPYHKRILTSAIFGGTFAGLGALAADPVTHFAGAARDTVVHLFEQVKSFIPGFGAPDVTPLTTVTPNTVPATIVQPDAPIVSSPAIPDAVPSVVAPTAGPVIDNTFSIPSLDIFKDIPAMFGINPTGDGIHVLPPFNESSSGLVDVGIAHAPNSVDAFLGNNAMQDIQSFWKGELANGNIDGDIRWHGRVVHVEDIVRKAVEGMSNPNLSEAARLQHGIDLAKFTAEGGVWDKHGFVDLPKYAPEAEGMIDAQRELNALSKLSDDLRIKGIAARGAATLPDVEQRVSNVMARAAEPQAVTAPTAPVKGVTPLTVTRPDGTPVTSTDAIIDGVTKPKAGAPRMVASPNFTIG